MDEAERGTQQDASRDDAPFAFGTPRDDPPRRERRAASDPAAGSPDAVAPTHAPASPGAPLPPESDEFTADVPRESSRYRVGHPIASAFSIVRRRGFALLVVMAAYAPVFVVDAQSSPAFDDLGFDPRWILVEFVARCLCGTFVVGAACDLVARHLAGDPPALGASLWRGLVVLPGLLVVHVLQGMTLVIPLFLVSFLTLGMDAPSMALLFFSAGLLGNLVLTARILPMAAVLVTERRWSPLAVLRRTDALTRGSRRRLVGTLIIASALVALLWFASAFVVAVVSPTAMHDAVRIAFELLCVGAFAVGPGVVYHELRAASEGPRPEELAQIFA
ncbi:MAG: hypothetical protein H6825_00175 [Planctomycetes bacterium]|nr:hypothetical protein [Planctomycetota bacterium]